MDDNGKIRVIPHRGTGQIGGVCTEIATDKSRVFFDIGAPLEGEENQDVLRIEGLTVGNVNADAVFLTHYHGDHTGQIPYVIKDVSIYMEKTAKRILELQQEHMKSVGQPVWAYKANEIEVGKPVQIKDLTITALASDHSAADSVMYLIEGCNKRILLTGDYRLHGYYHDKLVSTFRNLGHIDLMITEGTTITRDSSGTYDEEWVERQFRSIMENYKYVFLLTSSSNLDRIAAFSRCVPTGKYMLTDRYQWDLMQTYDENREKELQSNKVLYISDYVMEKAEKAGFGMVVRANYWFPLIVKDYFERCPDDTCMIYSMWSGYWDKTRIKQMLELCKGHERIVHVSGHVTKEDLEQVIVMVRPEKLIIHHTAASEEEEEGLSIPAETKLLHVADGDAIEV